MSTTMTAPRKYAALAYMKQEVVDLLNTYNFHTLDMSYRVNVRMTGIHLIEASARLKHALKCRRANFESPAARNNARAAMREVRQVIATLNDLLN
jgi:4'-phosphopantetheinyl transferase EntD